MPPATEPLQVSRQDRADGVIVRLRGRIDESFDPECLLDTGSGVLVIDMDGVSSITSFGVKEWVAALEGIAAEYYCFVGVRPSLVAQFNMVAGFAGHGQLVTLYSPAYCSRCKKIIEVLVDLRHEYAAIQSMEPPTVLCSCGAQAAFAAGGGG